MEQLTFNLAAASDAARALRAVKLGPHRHETTRADRLRGPAHRQGLVLVKSRLKVHLALDYGLYHLVPLAEKATASATPAYRLDEVEALILKGEQEISDDAASEKACNVCGQLKPLTEFWRHRRVRDGHQHTCKTCAAERYAIYLEENRRTINARSRRNQRKKRETDPEYTVRSHLRNLFRMELEEYQAKLAAQEGVCAICSVPPGPKRLHVDHDHGCCPGHRTCGKCVRDLLCSGMQ